MFNQEIFQIYATFLKKLDGMTGLAAVKRIIEQIEDYTLIGCCSDLGGEFSLVREYMQDIDKKYYVAPAQSASKISPAERSVRTIRTIAGRILDSGETSSAMQAVKLAITSHNSSPSSKRGGLAPDDVTPDNQGQVLKHKMKARFELESEAIGAPTFDKGQLVRIRELGSKFTKSNIPRYSKQVYQIDEVVPHSPTPGYRLRSTTTYALLPGSFNYSQLLKI